MSGALSGAASGRRRTMAREATSGAGAASSGAAAGRRGTTAREATSGAAGGREGPAAGGAGRRRVPVGSRFRASGAWASSKRRRAWARCGRA